MDEASSLNPKFLSAEELRPSATRHNTARRRRIFLSPTAPIHPQDAHDENGGHVAPNMEYSPPPGLQRWRTGSCPAIRFGEDGDAQSTTTVASASTASGIAPLQMLLPLREPMVNAPPYSAVAPLTSRTGFESAVRAREALVPPPPQPLHHHHHHRRQQYLAALPPTTATTTLRSTREIPLPPALPSIISSITAPPVATLPTPIATTTWRTGTKTRSSADGSPHPLYASSSSTPEHPSGGNTSNTTSHSSSSGAVVSDAHGEGSSVSLASSPMSGQTRRLSTSRVMMMHDAPTSFPFITFHCVQHGRGGEGGGGGSGHMMAMMDCISPNNKNNNSNPATHHHDGRSTSPLAATATDSLAPWHTSFKSFTYIEALLAKERDAIEASNTLLHSSSQDAVADGVAQALQQGMQGEGLALFGSIANGSGWGGATTSDTAVPTRSCDLPSVLEVVSRGSMELRQPLGQSPLLMMMNPNNNTNTNNNSSVRASSFSLMSSMAHLSRPHADEFSPAPEPSAELYGR